jgi:hypothetical protein
MTAHQAFQAMLDPAPECHLLLRGYFLLIVEQPDGSSLKDTTAVL